MLTLRTKILIVNRVMPTRVETVFLPHFTFKVVISHWPMIFAVRNFQQKGKLLFTLQKN